MPEKAGRDLRSHPHEHRPLPAHRDLLPDGRVLVAGGDGDSDALASAELYNPATFSSAPVTGFPPGPALVTVFVNGIPSLSKVIFVDKANTVYLPLALRPAPQPFRSAALLLSGLAEGGIAILDSILRGVSKSRASPATAAEPYR